MLHEEISKRTQLRLKIVTVRDKAPAAIVINAPNGGPADGFELTTSADTATITGSDDRGTIFGAGMLLRKLDMGRRGVSVETGLSLKTAPKTKVAASNSAIARRRTPTTAGPSRCGRQYIRELAIFGNNTHRTDSPRSDDDADSPHFPLSQIDMMEEMSRIADEYALDVSIWYPAMDRDYSDPKTVEAALNEWAEVYPPPATDRRDLRTGRRSGPHTAEIPDGDAREADRQPAPSTIRRPRCGCRPRASARSGSTSSSTIMDTRPAWLSGLVFGPQNPVALPEMRRRIDPRYPIRFYPDITHSFHAQFPAQQWDWVYASTEGRERCQPADRWLRPRSSASTTATPTASSPTRKAATTTSTSSCGAP